MSHPPVRRRIVIQDAIFVSRPHGVCLQHPWPLDLKVHAARFALHSNRRQHERCLGGIEAIGFAEFVMDVGCKFVNRGLTRELDHHDTYLMGANQGPGKLSANLAADSSAEIRATGPRSGQSWEGSVGWSCKSRPTFLQFQGGLQGLAA